MRDLPTQIGRYTVSRRLGQGGMGEVFLAYSAAGSPVAVKLIRTDRLDPNTRTRFEREAAIARTVIGTNRIARFLDADPYADRPWLAMEYVPGYTLLEYVDQHEILPAPLVASLVALLAEGLEAVHAAGLLHRDLKPQNVILGGEGPTIIDFGLAAFVDASASNDSVSQSGMIIGSVRCMPPEQADGNPRVSPAADVYALGTVLLYAASGHYPYDGRTWRDIVDQVTNPAVEPDLGGVPSRLLPLLRSMLAHEPGARPAVTAVAESCAALLRELQISPADARVALIGRTVGVHPSLRADQVPPADVEARLAELIDESADAEPGPLDVPPRPVDPEPDEPATESVAQSAPVPPAPPPAQPPKRRPASSRVAEQLRAAYAAQPVL
ncbi:serine/threonine-protein kinase [Micromonospora sp. DT62]|uniref:serine/threonine-protein kinase n=1 Tax=Micromonospora sp. DT62 TaxID=3416521 RepID=UPI003CE73D10